MFTVWQLKWEGGASPSPVSAENMGVRQHSSPLWACSQITAKEPWVLTSALPIKFSEEGNLQIPNLWIMTGLHRVYIYTSNSITILASVFLVSRERKIQTSSLNYSYIWIQFQFSSEKSHRVTATEHRTKHFPPPTCRQNIYAHTIPSFSLCLFLHQSPIP